MFKLTIIHFFQVGEMQGNSEDLLFGVLKLESEIEQINVPVVSTYTSTGIM